MSQLESSRAAMLRSVLAVIAGFVVALVTTYIVGIVGVSILQMFSDELADFSTPMIAAGAVGGVFGGMVTAQIGRTHARRDAGALAALLAVACIFWYVSGDSGWLLAALLAVVEVVGASLGGAALADIRGRRADIDAIAEEPIKRSFDARSTQLTLAVLLLLTSSFITVAFGHGGFVMGQAVFFSPLAAVLAIVMTFGLIQASLKLGARAFALCCSAAALLVLFFPVIVWITDFRWESAVTVLPFVLIWLVILARALFTGPRQSLTPTR